MSYRVVEEFEAALCDYTGAPYAVSVNSCSMAIFLALRWFYEHDKFHGMGEYEREYDWPQVEIPARTYASVPMSAMHAGFHIKWKTEKWSGAYQLNPLPVWDSARRFTSLMYRAGQFQCVSFQTSKILGLEQGGAVLHDSYQADTWLRRARFDGRLNAAEKLPQQIGWHCYLNPSTAALGLQRLACLPRDNMDQAGAMDFPDLSAIPCFR